MRPQLRVERRFCEDLECQLRALLLLLGMVPVADPEPADGDGKHTRLSARVAPGDQLAGEGND